MHFVLPDIKEVNEMKEKANEMKTRQTSTQKTLLSISEELFTLKTHLFEAILHEEQMTSRERNAAFGESLNEHNSLAPPKRIKFSFDQELNKYKDKIIAAVDCDDFNGASTYREQVGILCNKLRSSAKQESIPYRVIGKLFGVSGSAIHYEERKFNRGIKKNGRPTMLSESETIALEEIINNITKEDGFPTVVDVQDAIFENFNKVLTSATIRTILRRTKKFKIAVASPMEQARYECSTDSIKEYFNMLRKEVNDIPVGWVYNIDEAGQQDFVDSQEIHVVIPIDLNPKDLKYSVKRDGKRSTLIHCICSDGTFLRPMFVVPRKTIDSEVFSVITPGAAIFETSPTGFVNTELFCKWMDHEFLPSIQKKREETGYQGKAILLLDGFSAHHKCVEDDERKKQIDQLNVKVIFLPPHSSNQIQPLDLVTFALQKKWKRNIKVEKNFSYQSQQIIKTYESIIRASSPGYIVSAFKRAGIIRKSAKINDGRITQLHCVVDAFADVYQENLKKSNVVYQPEEITMEPNKQLSIVDTAEVINKYKSLF